MTDASGAKTLFVCYRKDDTAAVADRLAGDLRRLLRARIFLDRDSIDGGEPWPERLRQEIEASTAMLVLIGGRWLTLRTPDSIRRLDDPDDWVRLANGSASKSA